MQICKYVSMQLCKNTINSCVLLGPCLGRDGSDQFLPRYWSHPRGSHGEHFCFYSLDYLSFQPFLSEIFNRIGKVKKLHVNLLHFLREVNNFARQLISFYKRGEKLLMIILIRAMWSAEHENSISCLIRFCSLFIVKVCAQTFISREESCKRLWTFKTQKIGLVNLVLGVNELILWNLFVIRMIWFVCFILL